MAALFNRGLQSGKGFLPEAFGPDNFLPVLLQRIEVAKVPYPAHADKFGQRFFRKPLDVHAGLVTEMDKLAYQFCRTVRVLTEKLAGSAAGFMNLQTASAAWAGRWNLHRTALCLVFRNLRDNHVRLVNLDGVALSQ